MLISGDIRLLLCVFLFHLPSGLNEALDSELQIFLGVGDGNLGADASLALGDDGVGEADGVDGQLCNNIYFK